VTSHLAGIIIVFGDEDQPLRTVGRIIECERPTRLIIEWHIEEKPSTVTAKLSPTTDGAKLVLEHQRLPAGQAAGYGAAWQAGLEALAADLRGEDRPGRPNGTNERGICYPSTRLSSSPEWTAHLQDHRPFVGFAHQAAPMDDSSATV
jgi:hypothetical protein